MHADYLYRYYPPELADRIAAVRQSRTLASAGVTLHLDLYPQPRSDAPVLVLNHGGGGYGGLFAALALAFHRRGYCVVAPDQKGQGRSCGPAGDFTVAEAVQNIVDVASWARRQFAGRLYLAGASIGGGLTYAASAALTRQGQAPAAIACLNLYDFGDPRTALCFTRWPWLGRSRHLALLLRAMVRGLAACAPGLRLPYRPSARFDRMLDERDAGSGFYARWLADPRTLRSVTLRYLASMMSTPPAIALEDHAAVPVLVINQLRDRMVPRRLTSDAYARLSGPRAYQEIDWGHFSLRPAFGEELADACHAWFVRDHSLIC